MAVIFMARNKMKLLNIFIISVGFILTAESSIYKYPSDHSPSIKAESLLSTIKNIELLDRYKSWFVESMYLTGNKKQDGGGGWNVRIITPKGTVDLYMDLDTKNAELFLVEEQKYEKFLMSFDGDKYEIKKTKLPHEEMSNESDPFSGAPQPSN